jgi:hypothetical protein
MEPKEKAQRAQLLVEERMLISGLTPLGITGFLADEEMSKVMN